MIYLSDVACLAYGIAYRAYLFTILSVGCCWGRYRALPVRGSFRKIACYFCRVLGGNLLVRTQTRIRVFQRRCMRASWPADTTYGGYDATAVALFALLRPESEVVQAFPVAMNSDPSPR